MNNRNHQSQQRPSGFNCPVCTGFIPVSIQQLLSVERFVCPQCLLEIKLNKGESQKALDALAKVKSAEDGVKQASVFRV
jgi:transcription elongation factor Elf1